MPRNLCSPAIRCWASCPQQTTDAIASKSTSTANLPQFWQAFFQNDQMVIYDMILLVLTASICQCHPWQNQDG